MITHWVGMMLPMAMLVLCAIVCFKFVDYLKLKATLHEEGGAGGMGMSEIGERLDRLERRMTDVQDVMIALSEKFDRWEEEKIGI